MSISVKNILIDTFSVFGHTNPTNSDYVKAMRVFNTELSSLSTEQYSIISTTEDTHTVMASTATYSYGTGGDISSARPITIESVYLRDANSDDSQIDMLTELEYNDIVSKDSTGKPTGMFYKADFPLGSVTLYPVPDLSTYTLHILTTKAITAITALSDTITLPDEYTAYFIDSLVLRLGRHYGYKVTGVDNLLLADSEGNVKGVNSPGSVNRKAPTALLGVQRRRRIT